MASNQDPRLLAYNEFLTRRGIGTSSRKAYMAYVGKLLALLPPEPLTSDVEFHIMRSFPETKHPMIRGAWRHYVAMNDAEATAGIPKKQAGRAAMIPIVDPDALTRELRAVTQLRNALDVTFGEMISLSTSDLLHGDEFVEITVNKRITRIGGAMPELRQCCMDAIQLAALHREASLDDRKTVYVFTRAGDYADKTLFRQPAAMPKVIQSAMPYAGELLDPRSIELNDWLNNRPSRTLAQRG